MNIDWVGKFDFGEVAGGGLFGAVLGAPLARSDAHVSAKKHLQENCAAVAAHGCD